jgi:26S proteasome regulatory subunit N2
LGIIHANHGENITKYLVDALNNARNSEIIQHGACLGLGMAAMASGNEQLFENLQSVLLFDSAVAGEAAGIGMGLVMLGTASADSWNKMLAYAHETQVRANKNSIIILSTQSTLFFPSTFS